MYWSLWHILWFKVFASWVWKWESSIGASVHEQKKVRSISRCIYNTGHLSSFILVFNVSPSFIFILQSLCVWYSSSVAKVIPFQWKNFLSGIQLKLRIYIQSSPRLTMINEFEMIIERGAVQRTSHEESGPCRNCNSRE